MARTRSARKRRLLLQKCNKCIYIAISEIARNTINGNISLSEKRKYNLKRYKESIRELARKNISLNRRKKIINQKGGFLPGLLIPAISLIANIAARKLIK